MTKSTEDIIREYRDQQKQDGPAERWRKPVIPVAVEHDTSTATHDGTNWRAGYNATFDDETIERFRVGRACLQCWEPQEQAFPDKCSLCGYPIRHQQAADFAREFHGEKWMGPTTSLNDEFERLDDEGKRKRHTPGSSIWLPRGVSGDT